MEEINTCVYAKYMIEFLSLCKILHDRIFKFLYNFTKLAYNYMKTQIITIRSQAIGLHVE